MDRTYSNTLNRKLEQFYQNKFDGIEEMDKQKYILEQQIKAAHNAGDAGSVAH
jgi:hypothetical protein